MSIGALGNHGAQSRNELFVNLRHDTLREDLSGIERSVIRTAVRILTCERQGGAAFVRRDTSQVGGRADVCEVRLNLNRSCRYQCDAKPGSRQDRCARAPEGSPHDSASREIAELSTALLRTSSLQGYRHAAVQRCRGGHGFDGAISGLPRCVFQDHFDNEQRHHCAQADTESVADPIGPSAQGLDREAAGDEGRRQYDGQQLGIHAGCIPSTVRYRATPAPRLG